MAKPRHALFFMNTESTALPANGNFLVSAPVTSSETFQSLSRSELKKGFIIPSSKIKDLKITGSKPRALKTIFKFYFLHSN